MHVPPATLNRIVVPQSARSTDLDKLVHCIAQRLHGVGKVTPQQSSCLKGHASVVLAGEGERASCQQFGRIDLSGDLGNTYLHRHVLSDGELGIGQVSLTRPLNEVLVSASSQTKCGA